MPVAATVVSRSHLPFVRVLAASLLEHHPDARLVAVVVDGPAPGEAFEVLDPLALGMDERELHRRALAYNALGLLSSLRPHVIAHLLRAGASSVLLLDADTLVLAPLDDVWEAAERDAIALSPHTSTPGRYDAEGWTDEKYLTSGTFNGGLLAVGADGMPFLEWLAARSRRGCVHDPERGVVYSQAWLNLVPALFRHTVLRDVGLNTTVYGLDGRDLDAGTGPPRLAGTPIRLYHFTPFSGMVPGVDGRAAGALGDRPRLERLWDGYVERLRSAGWPAPDAYGWDRLASGQQVTHELRSRYREALIAAEDAGSEEPPDGFAADGVADFHAWWDDVQATDAASVSTDVVFGRPWIDGSAIDAVTRTLSSGWVGPGPQVLHFERALAAYLGDVHVCCVASATAALYLVLHAHGIGHGDEVLLPALTFVGCVQAIELTGATPVFVDCEQVRPSMSLGLAEEMITPRTRAVMVVHHAGRPVDLEGMTRLRDRHGLLVVEDATHALGAAWGDRRIGTSGNPTVFSFQASKNVTAIEGGAIATPDGDLAGRLARFAANGLDRAAWKRFSESGTPAYVAVSPGFKFTMNDVHAAVGLTQLPRLDEWIDLRARQWGRYDASFATLPISSPEQPAGGTRHARHLYQLTVGPDSPIEREALASRLRVAGIGTGVHFPALPLQPYLRERYGLEPEAYPHAVQFSARLLSLPLGPTLSTAGHERVVAALHAIFGGR